MENSAGKSSGAEISRKNSSLDIHSLDKSSVPKKERNNKRKSSAEDDGEIRKKRKIKKEVSLSSFKPGGKKSRNNTNEANSDGGCSGINGIALHLEVGSDAVTFLKRQRGLVRQKKCHSNRASRQLGSENCIVSKRLRPSSGQESSADQLTKLNAGTKGKFVTLMVKRELGYDKLKDKRFARVSLARHDQVEDDRPVVDNGDVSSKNHCVTRRKKNLESGSKSLGKTIEPLADDLIQLCKDSHDEDEENLEQNVARMLSSRFDPSCTSCLKSRPSESSTTNGLTFCIPSDEDFVSQGGNSFNGLDSVSADIASRVLKRRHFYEILSRDLDAYWVLKRRIKVFWPLDESWYYGLVNDYDPERKLHHIKYDDQDEGWVDLCNERFKLLVLRSEVPSKIDPIGATLCNNLRGNDLSTDDDSLIGSYMESKPIILWLAHTSCRVTTSALGVTKRRKTCHTSPDHLPHILSSKSNDVHGCLNMDSSKRRISKPSCGSAFLDGYTNSSSILECTGTVRDGKLPVVYNRRQFRYKDKRLPVALENKNTCSSGTGTATSAPIFHCFHASREDEFSIAHMESEGSLIPVFCNIFGAENTWLLHAVLLCQCGVLVNTWPKVLLEMLFVDNVVGLRFLLFEGCLKKALAFFFSLTSVRFKISNIVDIRKQHMFVFFGFSKVKFSKWLYLYFKLQQHCFPIKQLRLSECTYDNVKALGGSSNYPSLSFYGRKPAFEEESTQYIMPIGVSVIKESPSVGMSRSSSIPDPRHGKLVPFTLSFAAAPTFFLISHLKLLMENCVASISLQDHGSVYSHGHSENGGNVISDASPSTSSTENRSSGLLSDAKSCSVVETISKCNGSSQSNPSQNLSNGKFGVNRASTCSQHAEVIARDVVVHQGFADAVSVILPDTRRCSNLTGLSVEIPSVDQVGRPVTGTTPGAAQCTDLTWTTDGSIVQSSHTTGPSSICTDGMADFMCNGFSNGPKKPRTQVKYTSPLRGFDFCSNKRMHNQRGLPFRRIRKSDEKRTSYASKSLHGNLELLACDANVLITNGDRGWRECGARIILEQADHNEWSVVPGFTNRYTHAMIWKEGKDWALEFTDRSQWMLFKEVHEECYNRNARAASVKNIPIPGVRLKEECDDNGTEFQFLHSAPWFIRQVETDIDIAMNPARILYDMAHTLKIIKMQAIR
ncbi:Histone-lysine N-methyltransferase [Bertholletia excelsa]